MTRVSVSKRVAARSIAGSVEEFNSLAAKLADLCDVTADAHWELKTHEHQAADVWGLLDEKSGIDLSRVHGLTLWIGQQWADTRRITLTADLWGVRADVAGESPEWSRDAAAVVLGRLRNMRPWWWFWRTGFGVWILSIVAGVVAVAVASLYERLAGSSISGTAYTVIGAGTALLTSFLVSFTTFIVPTIRIGDRRPTASVVRGAVLWIFGAVGSGLIGAVIAAAAFPPSH